MEDVWSCTFDESVMLLFTLRPVHTFIFDLVGQDSFLENTEILFREFL